MNEEEQTFTAYMPDYPLDEERDQFIDPDLTQDDWFDAETF